MIEARFYVNKGQLCMKVEGHAHAAPKGEDLICAGTSTLAAALAETVTVLHRQGLLEKEPDIHMKAGFVRIKVKPTEEHRGELLLVFSTIAAGMSSLCRSYPEYIRVKLFEDSEILEFSK